MTPEQWAAWIYTQDVRDRLQASIQQELDLLASLDADIQALKDQASSWYEQQEALRREKLRSGEDCPLPELPDGFAVTRRTKLVVDCPSAIPASFMRRSPDTKKIKSALTKSQDVPGARPVHDRLERDQSVCNDALDEYEVGKTYDLLGLRASHLVKVIECLPEVVAPYLEVLSRHEDEFVRARVAGHPDAGPYLEVLSRDGRWYVRAIVTRHPDAEPCLEALSRDEAWEVREAAKRRLRERRGQ